MDDLGRMGGGSDAIALKALHSRQGGGRQDQKLKFTLYGKDRWGLWPGVKKLMKLDKDHSSGPGGAGIRRNLPQLASNLTLQPRRTGYRIREVQSAGLVTFVSLDNENEVMGIKSF